MTAAAATATTTYPTIPTLDAQRRDESPREFGLRAFRFLLTEQLCAAVLDSRTLEHAMAASQVVILGDAETSPVARERYRDVRLDILRTLDRRRREEQATAKRATVATSSPKPKDGGKPSPLRRPVPVVPPASTARRF